MEEEWEEFEYGPRTDYGELRVTMSRVGQISLGAKAMKDLGDPTAAMLLYKPKERMIGLRPVHPRHPKAIPLRSNFRDNYRLLRANRFCKHYGIEITRTLMFNTPVIEDGLLMLDLKAVTYIGRKR